jgi:excisionase family DNA binding protein
MATTKTQRYFPPLSQLGDEDFLGPDHLAAVLGVSRETIRKWRRDGFGPRFMRVGPRLVRVRAGDVRAWLDRGAIL